MSEEPALPASPTTPEEEKKREPLTPAQWLEIRTCAELGTERVRELARRFGISHQSVSQHLKEHGISIGSKAASITEKVAEKVAVAVIPFAEKRLARLEETRDFYYTSHTNIDKIIMSKIAVQVRDGRPIAELNGDLKALNFAKRSLLIGRAERFTVLDADKIVDIDALPDLVIRDLADQEIEILQKGGPDDPLEDLAEIIEEIVSIEGA